MGRAIRVVDDDLLGHAINRRKDRRVILAQTVTRSADDPGRVDRPSGGRRVGQID
jgi:hypothetical protein